MIADLALEKNRRAGWAKFYRTRAQLRASEETAIELACWLKRLHPELPPAAEYAVNLAWSAADDHAIRTAARYVAAHMEPPASEVRRSEES